MGTVLVTGAAGFIGSHTVEALVARGLRVVGLDNFDPYYDPARKHANLAEVRAALPPNAPFDLVQGDIRDQELLDHLCAVNRFDAIVHLAALPGIRASISQPMAYVDVNLQGTIALLECAKCHDVPNFVLASTSSVYGASGSAVLRESESCDQPLAPYPASKRAAELMAYAYHQLNGMSVTCLRFFTVYGPRGRPDMMTYKLVDAMFTRRSVPLYAGGQLQRDWTYVGDIVAGICAAVERPLGYELINLGRGCPVLLLDYLRSLERCTGMRAPVTDAPAPRSDMEHTCADISKARRLLGYEPSVSLEDGVARFWEWYQRSVLHPLDEVRTA